MDDELELLIDLGNRREDDRVALDVPMTVEGVPAKILNLSEKGLRFVANEKANQEVVELVLGDGSNQLTLKGQRVWSKEVGPGHSAVGVIFSDSGDLEKFRSLLRGEG